MVVQRTTAVGAVALLATFATGCQTSSTPTARTDGRTTPSTGQPTELDGLPATAAITEPSGSSAVDFAGVGELAATASIVVRGRITSVEPGKDIAFDDGSGMVITPRFLVVEVTDYLHTRDPKAATPAVVRVYDGYWMDGVGRQDESLEWAQPGEQGVFFLSQDAAPNGTLLPTYTPLGSEGRVLLAEEDTVYDHEPGSLWRQAVGSNASAAVLEQAVEAGVARAESGAVKPVLVKVCRPSDPSNEDSEPICEMK